jgi:hypothetical protein
MTTLPQIVYYLRSNETGAANNHNLHLLPPGCLLSVIVSTNLSDAELSFRLADTPEYAFSASFIIL